MYEGVVSDADVLGCGFCDALRGRVHDAPLALNDERFAVSMGQYQPTGPGYAFVAPHAHIQDLHSLPEHECGPMLQMVQRTSVAIQRTFGVSGTTVVQNNGLPGQSVPHLHFHIVPRHVGDGYPRRTEVPVPDHELLEQSRMLAAALSTDSASHTRASE